MSDFVAVHVERTESLDTWCVDDIGIIGNGVHLAESGGVFACAVSIGYLADTEVEVGEEGIDKCRFAHTAIT